MVFAAMANAERIKHMAIAKHALQSNKCKKKLISKFFSTPVTCLVTRAKFISGNVSCSGNN